MGNTKSKRRARCWIPCTDAEDMLKALAAGLDAHGIKPAAEPEAAGELKATKYHLEDLRKLLRIGRINVRKK